MVYTLYDPKLKPGVSVIMSATSSRKVYTPGDPKGSYKEKKYRLAESKPYPLSLKAYIHGKSNRNASNRINALLNYDYAVLELEVRKDLNSIGLDSSIVSCISYQTA